MKVPPQRAARAVPRVRGATAVPQARSVTAAVSAGAIAGTLALVAGCAAVGPTKGWRIEPLMRIAHAGASSADHYLMGRHHDSQQRWDLAAAAYREAIATDADNVEAHNALGVALAKLGQIDAAEMSFRRAFAIDPTRGHVLSNLGYLMLMAGRADDAAIELEEALKIDRHNPIAGANLRAALEVAQRRQASEAGAETAHGMLALKDDTAHMVVQQPASTDVQGVRVPVPVPVVISVPAAMTSIAVPAPLAGPVEVPTALAGAVATVEPLRVVDRPTVASLQSVGTTSQAGQRAQDAVTAHDAHAASGFAVRSSADPGSRLELSNGNGVPRMAASLRRWLKEYDIHASRLTNQRPFLQPMTTVEYRAGHEQEAQRIARALPFAAITAVEPKEMPRADVRVVLGHDASPMATCLKRPGCAEPADALAGAAGAPQHLLTFR